MAMASNLVFLSSFTDTAIFTPSFNGTSNLELPPFAFLLRSPGASETASSLANATAVTLHLAIKTPATQGTVLYSRVAFGMNVGPHVAVSLLPVGH
ncbi:hypothetical protein DPEC_G00326810 [Dallia pectoralis]|uniref:Uncharacterized protein n=1 Tax=Dallia pectoralis TaxID=75939 RepID=A0ACC2F7X5_DALPE|nr:hypothetical protein DPEC_G00326810 [Dallia pectoralis]